MSVLESVLDRRRLVLTVTLLLSLTGLAAWATMIRREDPVMPAYWGQVVVAFPGADAEMVERLVLEPIEDALSEVEEVHTVSSTAWAEVAVVAVDLDENTGDTDAAWDDVRRALDTARQEFPSGVGEPVLNSKMSTDHDAVVLAITGSAEPTRLLAAARTIREGLLDVPDVSRVKIVGDPGEQVTVELDDAAARRLGLSPPLLAAQLSARTRILPGGSLALGERTLRLRPLAEMESVDEIAATPIRLPSGATVPLGEVAGVRFGSREPATQRMRVDGEMAVGVAVVAAEGANAVRFGDAVRTRLDEIIGRVAPLEVHTVAFQPERVSTRLAQLNESLLMGILIVAGVVILAMGLRLGLVVASVVPLVTFAALAVFAAGGGVLHQISIAALVLALGMLVDNAIVMAENVQRRLDLGEDRREATLGSVRELAVPLAAATATTIAAFIPMLLADGGTGDFTRSIPVMLILTLGISYLFSVFVTPVLAEAALVPGSSRATAFTDALGRRLATLATRRSGLVLLAAGGLVAVSLTASGWVRQEFFPAADRNQLVVDLRLPEGAHINATDTAARTVERLLAEREDVVQVASFIGRGAPRFYYNIQSVPWSPHFAQLMVATRGVADVEPVLEWVRSEAPRRLPGVEVTGRRLEQGPPVGAPVEVRLFGDDLGGLAEAATAVAGVLRSTPGAVDVRHDLGPGEPTLRFAVDDAAASRYGLSRVDVARALYGHTRGLPVGELRSGDDPVPIVVRTSAGERLAADDLAGLQVAGPTGETVPLAQLVRVEPAWRPAAINHRDRQRIATVSAQLDAGATYSDVLRAASPQLAAMTLPAGVRMAFGGEAEGSGEANTALLRNLPLGLLLLLGVLLAEFNSFRRVGIILVTVPLAATGVVPGLLISGQPFGFMSMLGVFALVGIVVNNAIVLLEVVEQRRREGASVDEALGDAVLQRIRPILLTTATTVCGLVPLALSPSTLWPPLAWAMISGLLASTLLTLVVVPSLYRVMLGRPARRLRRLVRPLPTAAAVLVLAVVGAAATARAAEPLPVDLATALVRGAERPAAEAADLRAEAVAHAGLAERRLATLPRVAVTASVSDRDRELELVTPIGSFPFGDARTESAAVQLRQPLLDPARLLHANPATRAEAEAEALRSDRTRLELSEVAAGSYLDLLAVDARRRATSSYQRSLAARLEEMEARVDAGRVLEADALKVRLAMEEAELDLASLDEARRVTAESLARAVGWSGEVVAMPAPSWAIRPVPGLDELLERARGGRRDVAALERAATAAEHRRAAVRAELLPRLDATATWSWTSGSPYTEDRWLEGAVVVSWAPFAAGTRGPRAAALAARTEGLRRELAEAERGVAVEVGAARAELVTARDAVEVARRGVEYATETLRVERERHAAGRATTNDLLDATSALRRQRTRLDLARLDVVRAWVRLGVAVGDLGGLMGEG